MDLEKLKAFIAFMDEHNLCELELEEEGQRVKLKKAFGEQQPLLVPQVVASAPESSKEDRAEGLVQVTSPMVGSFYRASSPGAKPYVEVGDSIKPGDIVCIIEAMKLMNEIKAEVGGRIVEILVENGQPVEFGQTLFLMEPA